MSRDGVVRSSKRIIRVTPTVDTSAYAAGDVLFNPTEIPRAVIEKGGCSKLIGITIIDQDDNSHMDIDLIFMTVSKDLGTINAAPDITDANLELARILGIAKIDSSDNEIDLAGSKVYTFSSATGNAGAHPLPMILEAADDSTSVYVAAITQVTPTFAAADDIDLVFHIED
jgi:hypothetical protein